MSNRWCLAVWCRGAPCLLGKHSNLLQVGLFQCFITRPCFCIEAELPKHWPEILLYFCCMPAVSVISFWHVCYTKKYSRCSLFCRPFLISASVLLDCLQLQTGLCCLISNIAGTLRKFVLQQNCYWCQHPFVWWLVSLHGKLGNNGRIHICTLHVGVDWTTVISLKAVLVNCNRHHLQTMSGIRRQILRSWWTIDRERVQTGFRPSIIM